MNDEVNVSGVEFQAKLKDLEQSIIELSSAVNVDGENIVFASNFANREDNRLNYARKLESSLKLKDESLSNLVEIIGADKKLNRNIYEDIYESMADNLLRLQLQIATLEKRISKFDPRERHVSLDMAFEKLKGQESDITGDIIKLGIPFIKVDWNSEVKAGELLSKIAAYEVVNKENPIVLEAFGVYEENLEVINNLKEIKPLSEVGYLAYLEETNNKLLGSSAGDIDVKVAKKVFSRR